jgi:Ca2+-binding RTX toxin-like protein
MRNTIENLESRMLLSANFVLPTNAHPMYNYAWVDHTTHVLTVEGTTGADQLSVEIGSSVEVWINDTRFLTDDLSDIRGIAMYGYGGNDSLYVSDQLVIPSTLSGDAGNDTLYGGNGNDLIDGGTGADVLSGGVGTDTIDYSNRTNPLRIIIGAGPTSGEAGENDNILNDFEIVQGGVGNDFIVGSLNKNMQIFGNAGNDSLTGGNANDMLDGGDGDDLLNGGYGADAFFGGNGNDTIDYSMRINSVRADLRGSIGNGQAGENDYIAASSVENVLGGAGNDVLIGDDHDNRLAGNAGADSLVGNGGNDSLIGGDGNDSLYGGMGSNILEGDNGSDTLVSVGGSTTDLDLGGASLDTFWADSSTTEFLDADSSELSFGLVHRVGAFSDARITNDSTGITTDTPTPRDPLGQNLPDPYAPINGSTPFYARFSNVPLFTSSGPADADIAQGFVGDCYFLSTLGAIARVNPDVIRQHVTEMGDGTYIVRFERDGHDVFYRVDADLPTFGRGMPGYQGNYQFNSMWASVMEKAFALFRHNDGRYASIEAGWPSEVFQALGFSSASSGFEWSGADLLRTIKTHLDAGQAVTFCTPGGAAPVWSALEESHCYIVEGVNLDASGNPVSLILRNPWGYDGGSAAAADSNPGDGLITVSAADAYNFCSTVTWATV